MTDFKRCVRCNGMTFVYKVGGAYSQVNMGGEKVTCPYCRGLGKVEVRQVAKRARKKKVVENVEKD